MVIARMLLRGALALASAMAKLLVGFRATPDLRARCGRVHSRFPSTGAGTTTREQLRLEKQQRPEGRLRRRGRKQARQGLAAWRFLAMLKI